MAVVLSKRERLIAIAAVAVIGVLGLDRFMVTPLLAQREDLDKTISRQRDELHRDERLFTQSRQMMRNWGKITAGALKHNSNDAESQMLHSVRDWAQDAGLTLSSIKPERAEKEKDFNKLTYRATATGGMGQISRFLWRVQTAPIPARITDLSITARKEGTDDLSLQVGIGTIYVTPDASRAAAEAAAAGTSAGGRVQ